MKLPGFDILDKIGEGGTAVVWKAYQVSLDRIVAIKILKPEFAGSSRDVTDFIREARAAAKFKHPSVVQVYDVSEQKGVYYFVMEYVGGPSIATIIDEQRTVPQKNALKVAQSVAKALESAWDKSRLIHRDIKPDNIMLDDDDTVKLADLGLARKGGAQSAATADSEGMVEGTPNYMSPEQARNTDKLDCRTDMYSLGATLYHMLTGTPPFDGYEPTETLSLHMNGHIPNPRDINPAVTPAMAQFITKLMMKESRDRYATWSNVLTDIKKVSTNRILVIKKRPDADSTISEPEHKNYASDIDNNSVAPIPLWFSAAAWLILFAWWGTYVVSELKLPPLPPRQTTRPLPATHSPASPTAATPIPPAAVPQPTPPAAAAKPAEKTPDKPVEQPTQSETNSASATPATQIDEKDQMEFLGMKVSDCLLSEDFAGAQALLQQEKGKPHTEEALAKIEELKTFVRDISNMPTLIENAFRMKLSEQKEIEVVINKQRRQLLIRAISNGIVYAATVGTNEESVSFTLSQLDPLERNRWLAADKTPAKCAMKFILFMKAKDYRSAKALAANCEPLAGCFSKEIDSTSQARQ
jgi:serine/threonine-protein kinase